MPNVSEPLKQPMIISHEKKGLLGSKIETVVPDLIGPSFLARSL